MNFPNSLTLFRISIIPFFFTVVLYSSPERDAYRTAALILFVVASITDAIDGFIARKWNLRTEIGTFLDPLADKLLIISAFLAFTMTSFPIKPPLWVISIVIFRDIFIIAGLVIVFLTSHRIKIEPNLLGKTTTFFQMLTIILTLIQTSIVAFFWFVTAGLTVASGIVYIVREMRRLNESNKLGKP